MERIRTLREGVRERLALYVKAYVAVLAASITLAGSAALAAATDRLPWGLAIAIGEAAAAVGVTVSRGLVRAGREWDAAVADSVQAIDKLMEEEVEHDVDAPSPDDDRVRA